VAKDLVVSAALPDALDHLETWFAASEKTIQSEICPANVEIAVSFATYPEVKSSALSLP
jgi:hypothetical protein